LPTRVAYPTVSTPLGSNAVLQITYPGQIENITANGQSTTAWPYAEAEYTNVAVKITGTWAGTLAFETSADGVSWSSLTMIKRTAGGTNLGSFSSTTDNGLFTADSAATIADYDFFRVRATAWTSGTAVVCVGMRGAQPPAQFTGGRFTGNPSRIYVRAGFWTSSDWSDNGNAGTKLFFFSQQNTGGQSNNHYVNLTDSAASGLVYPLVGLQKTGWGSNANYTPSQSFTHGAWRDLEFIAEAGTAGGSDGVVKVWIDNTLVVDQSNVPLFGSAMSPSFTSVFWAPTFGGGYNPPVNQTMRIAQVYLESAP
jgi:hypothetical protein